MPIGRRGILDCKAYQGLSQLENTQHISQNFTLDGDYERQEVWQQFVVLFEATESLMAQFKTNIITTNNVKDLF